MPVWSRSGAHDLWDRVHDPNGCGACNDAGKELLTFLFHSVQYICGSKRSPSTNRLDNILIPSIGIVLTLLSCDRWTGDGAWMLLLKRGSECHTDQLLCVKMKRTKKAYHQKAPLTKTKRFDVCKLARAGTEMGTTVGPPRGACSRNRW